MDRNIPETNECCSPGDVPRTGGACGRWCSVLREAVDWVFVAAAFGLLFNLYDSDGIELRAALKAPPTYQNVVKKPPADYPGFKRRGAPIAAKTPVPTAASSFTRLSLEGAKLRYGKALFVDARPSADYLKGHIAGAIPFDVNDFDKAAPAALPLLPMDREIVTYCSGGDCDDSVMLALKLQAMGYKDVRLYEGGYPEWKKAGMPVGKGVTP